MLQCSLAAEPQYIQPLPTSNDVHWYGLVSFGTLARDGFAGHGTGKPYGMEFVGEFENFFFVSCSNLLLVE